MNDENIKKLVETRDWLVKEIAGNEANMIIMEKYYRPHIDKIDVLIEKILQTNEKICNLISVPKNHPDNEKFNEWVAGGMK